MQDGQAPSRCVFAACLTGVVVLLYLCLASVLLYGQVSQQAELGVALPFLCRFLLPGTLAQVLSAARMDTPALSVAVASCFALFPHFAVLVLGGTRALLNVRRPDHARALLLIGAGALMWLPLCWQCLPVELKALMVAPLPALTMFLAVGNVMELTMSNELVPVLALCAFAGALLQPARLTWRDARITEYQRGSRREVFLDIQPDRFPDERQMLAMMAGIAHGVACVATGGRWSDRGMHNVYEPMWHSRADVTPTCSADVCKFLTRSGHGRRLDS